MASFVNSPKVHHLRYDHGLELIFQFSEILLVKNIWYSKSVLICSDTHKFARNPTFRQRNLSRFLNSSTFLSLISYTIPVTYYESISEMDYIPLDRKANIGSSRTLSLEAFSCKVYSGLSSYTRVKNFRTCPWNFSVWRFCSRIFISSIACGRISIFRCMVTTNEIM